MLLAYCIEPNYFFTCSSAPTPGIFLYAGPHHIPYVFYQIWTCRMGRPKMRLNLIGLEGVPAMCILCGCAIMHKERCPAYLLHFRPQLRHNLLKFILKTTFESYTSAFRISKTRRFLIQLPQNFKFYNFFHQFLSTTTFLSFSFFSSN